MAQGQPLGAVGCLVVACKASLIPPRTAPAAHAYCMIAWRCLWLSFMLTRCFHSAAASGTGNANATAAALAASSKQLSPLFTEP